MNKHFWALGISGLGVGYLIGLSASPVLQTILAGVITAICTLTALFTGVKATDENTDEKPATKTIVPSVNAIPMMCLILGLVFGSAFGIYLRTHDWLGAGTDTEVKRWKQTGLTEQQIYRRIFEHSYPPQSTPGATLVVGGPAAPDPAAGVLFSGTTAAKLNCESLKNTPTDEIRRQLAQLDDQRVANFMSATTTDKSVEDFVNNYLCSKNLH